MSKTITKFITEFRKEEAMEDKPDPETLPLEPSHLDRLKRVNRVIRRRHMLSGPKADECDDAQHEMDQFAEKATRAMYDLPVKVAIACATAGEAWDSAPWSAPWHAEPGFTTEDSDPVVTDGDPVLGPEFIPETKLTATDCTDALKERMASAERINELTKRLGDSLADRWWQMLDSGKELTPLPPSTKPLIEGKGRFDEIPYRGKEPDPIPDDELDRIEKLLDECGKPLRDLNPAAAKAFALRKEEESKNRSETERAKKLLDECYQPVDFDPSQVKAWGVHHANDQTLAEVNRIRANIEDTLRAKAEPRKAVFVITEGGFPAVVPEPRATDRVIPEEDLTDEMRQFREWVLSRAQPIGLSNPDDIDESDIEKEFDELLKDADITRRR